MNSILRSFIAAGALAGIYLAGVFGMTLLLEIIVGIDLASYLHSLPLYVVGLITGVSVLPLLNLGWRIQNRILGMRETQES